MDMTRKTDPNVWNRVFSKDKDSVTRRIAGEYFIIPVRGKLADMQRIYTLNPVAELIWQALDGATSLENIRGQVLSSFEAEKERLDADIISFIDELLDAGLISG